jgi:5'-deoxynucleotidase YfbR-like HD superfamily hydrolase
VTWMQTRDGAIVDLLKPDLGTLSIEEVAHSLARINRFAGHTREAYSVAQHSVHVSWQCNTEHALIGLLHDAHESVMGDITSPVKMALRSLELNHGWSDAFKRFEQRLISEFMARFSTNQTPLGWKRLPSDVKRADLVMLAIERRDLLGPESQPWNITCDGEEIKAPLYFKSGPGVIQPYISVCTAQQAERMFLLRYEQLVAK